MATSERTLIVRPILGMWAVDSAQDLPDGASPDMMNMQVYAGILRKRPGYAIYPSEFATQPAERITGMYSTHDDNNNSRLYATTPTQLYRYNTITGNWNFMTGPLLTGGDSLFDFAVYASHLLFCQGIDNVMDLPLDGTTFAVLSVDSRPARYLANFNRRVFLGWTREAGPAEMPYRIQWCANEAKTDWTGIGSGFVERNDDPFFIRNIKKIMTALAVYTERSIWMGQITGSAVNPTSYDRVVSDIGLAAPHTLKGRNTNHFFVGNDDFYVFNGTQVQALTTQIRANIYNELNPSTLDRGFALIDVTSQEYLAFLPILTNSDPTRVWVVNWEAKAVYPWETENYPMSAGVIYKSSVGVTIQSLVGTIAQQNWVIGASTFASQNEFMITGSITGRIFYWSPAFMSDAGLAINCRWTSKDFCAKDIDPSLAGEMVTLKSIGISVKDPGSQFTLQFSLSSDGGATWQGPYPLTLGGVKHNAILDGMLTEQITGSRVAWKVENDTGTESFAIVAFYPTLERKQQKIAQPI